VAVIAAVGGGVLIGHRALAILMPVALLTLAYGYWRHRHPLPLALGIAASGIGYLHIFGGTPEWTLTFVVALSVAAAVADWRATGGKPFRLSDLRREFWRHRSSW
jgi:hypothetical protein